MTEPYLQEQHRTNLSLLALQKLGWELELAPYPGSECREIVHLHLRYQDGTRDTFSLKENYGTRDKATILGWLVDALEARGLRREVGWDAPDNCCVGVGKVIYSFPNLQDHMYLEYLGDDEGKYLAVAFGDEFSATLAAVLKAAELLEDLEEKM